MYQELVPHQKNPFSWNQIWNAEYDKTGSTAFHSYYKNMYLRDANYKKFGFNKFYTLDSKPAITHQDRTDNSPYVNDAASYQNIIDQLNTEEHPQFLQLVTMQNHMTYDNWYFNNQFNQANVTENLNDYERGQINTYAKGVSITDQATIDFLNQLNAMDKPITVIFYGDHLPSSYQTAAEDKNNTLALHQTDYFIWSNQASASAGVKLDASATAYTSPNYFMEMAAEHMNAKVSPYLAFLTQARTDIPSFERLVLGAGGFTTDTSTTYLDRNGNTVKRKNLSKQAKNTLNDYELIQYDMTAGKGYLTGTDFFKMKKQQVAIRQTSTGCNTKATPNDGRAYNKFIINVSRKRESMPSLLNQVKKYLPVSSRSFHAFEQKNINKMQYLEGAIEKLQAQNAELLQKLDSLKDQSHEAHSYEQTRDMMMFWQLFRHSDENLEEAKKRFFRGLPKAHGLARLFQQAETKLFKEFNSLCRKYNIAYWMGSGTLLGAYIYNDIIPWDDDVDVFITRKQLAELQQILQDDETFHVTVVWDWYVPCKQIRFKLRDEKNPTFIDLFPLDTITGNYSEAWNITSQARVDFVSDIRKKFTGTEWEKTPYLYDNSALAEQIEYVLDEHYRALSEKINFTDDLQTASGLVRGIENIDETHSSGPYPIDDWMPTINMRFDDFDVPAPPAWRKYLQNLYGDFLQIPHDIDSHEHVDNHYLQDDAVLASLEKYVNS